MAAVGLSNMDSAHKKILCVGSVCIDLVNDCFSYPEEDSDQRCLGLRIQRGGNAVNNCTVLSQIGASCEFFGYLTTDTKLDFLTADFKEHKIAIENCPIWEPKGDKNFLEEFPLSTILVNSKNGSRTVLQSKGDMPELSAEDFKKMDLSKYCWVHFEGRNVNEVSIMMAYIRSWRTQNSSLNPFISVELEQANADILKLAKLADCLFVGKDFARFHGWNGMEATIKGMFDYVSEGSVIISAWGEQGCSAMCPHPKPVRNDSTACFKDFTGKCFEKSEMYFSPAFPPEHVLDTLGAGDTFAAGVMRAISSGISIEKSICFGCQLAGSKVGRKGFSGLKEDYLKLMKKYPEFLSQQ